MAVQFSCK